jgi:hypothetical protein
VGSRRPARAPTPQRGALTHPAQHSSGKPQPLYIFHAQAGCRSGSPRGGLESRRHPPSRSHHRSWPVTTDDAAQAERSSA